MFWREMGLQITHRSPSSSWLETSLVSSQKHPRGAGKPHHLTALVVSPPHRLYNISAFPTLPTSPGRLFPHEANPKWLQRVVFPYVPPPPCPRHLCLLPSVVSHAADKTSGIQDVLSKTMRAKISHGASQHDHKHTLFSRCVSLRFLLMLVGRGGATLLLI